MSKSPTALEWTNPAGCNCLALRQAARHVSQFYDQFLIGSGLRTTQYSILARLQRKGTMSINALATELVMDRTTLGRNILPLQRDGLIAIAAGQADRRSKAPRGCAPRSKPGIRPRRDSRQRSATEGPKSCARSFMRSRPMRRSPPQVNFGDS